MILNVIEKLLLTSYFMILPSFIVSLLLMNGDLLLYSMGFCGLMLCLHGIAEDNK